MKKVEISGKLNLDKMMLTEVDSFRLAKNALVGTVVLQKLTIMLLHK